MGHDRKEEPSWSGADLHSLLRNALDVVTILGPDGRRRYVSPAIERVLGYPPGDLIGADPFTLVHPNDAARVRRLFADVVAMPGGGHASTEFRARHRDGSWRWLEAVGTNLLDDPGVAGVVVNARDVTERKAAEGSLRASEQRARDLATEAQRQARELALLDRVRTALAREMEPAVVVRTVVEAIAVAFGYTQVSLYLRHGNGLVLQHQVGYPQVLPCVPLTRGVMGRVARTGEPVLLPDARADPAFLGAIAGIVSEVCVPVRVGDGVAGVLNVESTDGAVLSEADLGLMVALADHVGIALERVRLDEAHRADEARFRSLVQNASDVVAILDPDGTWCYVSPPVERLLGHRPDELIGHRLEALVHPDEISQTRRFFAAATADPPSTLEVELRLRHRDGSWHWFELRGTNLLDDPGVAGIVVNARDVTERKALEAQLARLAATDPLTGLPNRTLFLDRLGHALARAAQERSEVCVLFLDLDRFKVLNDSLGHEAGDRALLAVAERLVAAVRPSDTVARFGGDEFMVLLEGCSTGEATTVAERVLAALRVPLRVNGHDAIIDASVGIAVSTSALKDPADLLRAADTALYHAKATGRGRVVVFESGMYADAVMRLDRETALRAAVAQGQLRLQFQPEIDLGTGRIASLEALVRWDRPGHGTVAPEDFIPVAEETGLILPLGEWVLAEACRQARTWSVPRGAEEAPTVSVNVSARQVRQAQFADQIARVLRETGLAAERLKLEVTERVFVEDAAATGEALRGVKALGVGLAIDDFGMEYSSLGYLRRLPVDTLKIDRAFVGGVGSEGQDQAILVAIAGLAHALGVTVTAEGVETAKQLALARRAGCDRAQGYYLGRPLDPAALPMLLARSPLIETGRR